MKVAEIRLLLEQSEGNKDLLYELQHDTRRSVQNMLAVWERKQARHRQEQTRIWNLYRYERELGAQGYELVAGVDEAGRGPLAGPVLVAAVVLPLECDIPGINDSKKMTKLQRECAYEVIRRDALAVSSVAIDPARIDAINIYQATVQGMYQALAGLQVAAKAVLIDAVPLKELTIPWQALIGGDGLSASIAAASIIAKVERDRMMEEYDRQYPAYGFAQHKGYGTVEHLRALQKYGACPIHRQSFAPVRDCPCQDSDAG